MYLHNDKVLFTDVIIEANAQTGIAESIIPFLPRPVDPFSLTVLPS